MGKDFSISFTTKKNTAVTANLKSLSIKNRLQMIYAVIFARRLNVTGLDEFREVPTKRAKCAKE